MEWGIFLPERSREIPDRYDFFAYLNSLAYRWFQGHFRYGRPDRKKLYLTRLKKELSAYEKTGNAEHLRNIAVYTYLEDYCPENRKHHFDASVGSVTRDSHG